MPNRVYSRCVTCSGSGIVKNPDGSGMMSTCLVCNGEKYVPAGIDLDELRSVIEDSREAHRYYNPDGTFTYVKDADQVRTLRIAAALKIKMLREACIKANISIPFEDIKTV